MSTFSGLNTAASGLAAARRGMDVVGQNIANQTTEGYTRQRVLTSAIPAVATVGLFSVGAVPGQGVSIDGVVRLGDALLDARVRDAWASAGHWSTRAVAATTIEATLAEPTEDGLAARLSAFWAGWQDLANAPDSGAAASVVIESARELSEHIAGGYRTVSAQWADARARAGLAVDQVNATADQIAALNREIRDALASGRSANELIDQRAVLAQDAARLAGASARIESDGTLTVRVDGNALVSGSDSRHLALTGPSSVQAGERVSVVWADATDVPVALGGGELGGGLSVLAPAADGGPLAGLADAYDRVAVALAEAVNAQHRAGVTAGGQAGGDFFALDPAGPAALGLSVVVGAPEELALARPDSGALDAGNADAISQIGVSAGGPDSLWADEVASLSVATAAAVQRARTSEMTADAATAAQRSVAAVDGDEETVSLLTYQTAYQAAARVLTAVDEALDVLINRTGVVGR